MDQIVAFQTRAPGRVVAGEGGGRRVRREGRLGWHVYAAKYWLSTHSGPEWREARAVHLGGIEGAPSVAISAEAKVTIYLPDNGRAVATADDELSRG